MLKTNVYNMSGKLVGEIELPEAVFGIEPNEAAVHDAVKNHLANKRQGTQSALTRAEVSGGGRKPWRQKGTGRARQGSTRAPQWTHGGIVFAPKPRDYSYSLNKKAQYFFYVRVYAQDDATKKVAPVTITIKLEGVTEVVVKQFVDSKWVELKSTVNGDGTVTIEGVVEAPMAIFTK